MNTVFSVELIFNEKYESTLEYIQKNGDIVSE